MAEREEGDLIEQIERQMGLAHGSMPTWGYDLNQKIFSEEAPTREQRRFAGWFVRNFSYFVMGYNQAGRINPLPPLSTSHVQAFYYRDCEEMRSRWGETFRDFTLSQAVGSAHRTIAWVEELKEYEESSLYDHMLARLRPAQTLLQQAAGLTRTK